MTALRSAKVLMCASVLATAGLAPAFGQVSPPLGCGSVITTDTTLTADITNCSSNGLIVDADKITIDFNGHTVSGDGIPAAHDDIHFDYGIIVESRHGVTITNGSLSAFDRGVMFDASPGGVVTAMHVHDNSNRGIMFDNGSDNARVKRNTPTDNGASGIAVVASKGALITRNRSLRNLGGAGVRLDGATRATVLHNRLIDNVFAVQATDSQTAYIRGNRMAGGEVGVFMAFSDGYAVSHNRISRTGAGVSIEGSDRNQFTRNRIVHSVASACDGCGIESRSTATTT